MPTTASSFQLKKYQTEFYQQKSQQNYLDVMEDKNAKQMLLLHIMKSKIKVGLYLFNAIIFFF